MCIDFLEKMWDPRHLIILWASTACYNCIVDNKWNSERDCGCVRSHFAFMLGHFHLLAQWPCWYLPPEISVLHILDFVLHWYQLMTVISQTRWSLCFRRSWSSGCDIIANMNIHDYFVSKGTFPFRIVNISNRVFLTPAWLHTFWRILSSRMLQ
jgi:hypothetical protein